MHDPVKTRETITHDVKRKQVKVNDASWRGAPELPTAEELMKNTPTLYPDFAQPKTKEEYLERLYRAYRHEGIELLRRVVDNYRRKRDEDRSSYVYSKVRVRGYTFSRHGAACRLAFSTEKSKTRVDWYDQDENRLKVGSVVALSNDNFKSQCLVGVVAARPLEGGLFPDSLKGEHAWTAPRIDIFWSRVEDSVWDPAEEMVMVEARSSYYEPVRYAMLGLQHAAEKESRFDKYLVNLHQEDPGHESFDPGDTIVYPPSAASFDYSQDLAYLRMTTKELAIVQGPPGTGKTFTSVVALETLVAKNGPIAPVIISAHTNHAVDQLLRECMRIGMSVARLGSRTQDEEIEQRTIYNIAKASRFGGKGNMYWQKSRAEKVRFIEEARNLCFPPELVLARTLLKYSIITQQQYDSLSNDEWEDAEDLCKDPLRPPPDGIEPGMESILEEEEAKLMRSWMAIQTEQDRSHLYKPPTNQSESVAPGPLLDCQPGEQSGSDLEGVEGPTRKVAKAPELKNRKLDGQYVSLHLGLTGTGVDQRGISWWHKKSRQLLKENDDLYNIRPDQRGPVYLYLRQQLVQKIAEEIIRPNMHKYKADCEAIKIDNECRDVYLLNREKIRVVGCTTTGLTKYRGLISALEPRVLLVEEAAETQEPNVSAALVPSLEQLILVGDHQQLAPSVNVHDMKQFLEKSLFERLVLQKVPFSQLQVQRRMAPQIRQVVQAFYPKLSDHDIVKDLQERPVVRGVDHRLWWFQHRWPDSRHNTSSVNVEEARMIIRLYQYLVQNGLGINQITILSFYKAQVEMIKHLLSRDGFFGRVRSRQQENQGPRLANKAADWDSVARTVDGFQGEQNEVIILSAVRSCSSSGFVSVENRAVVALSRAKRGMYVFGNEETLLGDDAGKKTWGKVFDVFHNQAMVGETFPITCVKHERVTEIVDVESWSQFKDGGCDLPCEGDRPDNPGEKDHCPEHACHLSCHPPGQTVACRQTCGKVLACKHRCVRTCGKQCNCEHGCDEPAIKAPIKMSSRVSPRVSGRANIKENARLHHPTMTIRPGGAGQSSTLEQTSEQPAFNFRKRYCGLDDDAKMPAGLDPVLQPEPVIHETWKKTTVNADGARQVTDVFHTGHGQSLIDFSEPEPEPEPKIQPAPGPKPAQETVGANEEEDTREDWLIEL